MSRSQRRNKKERKKLKVFVDSMRHQPHVVTPEMRRIFGDNQRAINRFENPLQNLVDDTNKLLEGYTGTPIDDANLASLRSALYGMIESWKHEGLIKETFEAQKYVQQILDKVKAQVPTEMRDNLTVDA